VFQQLCRNTLSSIQWNQLPLEEDIRLVGTPLPIKEAKNDEWYIEAVVTSPDYREAVGSIVLHTPFLSNHHKR
jgi:hypothetical protein